MNGDETGLREARRARIREVLKHLSARALSLFDKAIEAAAQAPTDEMAVPMLGHALRELTRLLPRFVEIPLEKKRVDYADPIGRIAEEWSKVDAPERRLTLNQFTILEGLVNDHQASTHRAQDRAAALARTTGFGALDEDPAVLGGLARRWKKIEGRFPSFAHPDDDGTVQPPAAAVELLDAYEELLDHTLAGFWDVDAAIKAVIAGGPSAEAYAIAKALPKSIQHWRRLYEQLGPEWLVHVLDAGDFEHPPEWVTRSVRPMGWPALDYLKRVAPQSPGLAARSLLRVPARISGWAEADVLEIAAALDPSTVRPLAQRANAWLRGAPPGDMLLADRAGTLMQRMAEGGFVDEAFRIADALLETRWEEPPPVSRGRQRQRALDARITTYSFGAVLEDRYPALVTAAAERALALLTTILGRALDQVGDQYWNIWLPSVREVRAREGVVETLVFALYRSALQVATSEPAAAEAALRDLADRSGPIMRRLELALLAETGLRRDRVREIFGSRASFDDTDILHEYAGALVARWNDLGEDTHERIRQWIADGPTFEVVEADRERAISRWRRRWLAILDPVLPPAWREQFADTLQLPGPEQPTRFASHAIWSGPNSPLTAVELQAMTNAELFEYLNSWVPEAPRGPEPSVEGLARVLEAVVSGSPERFAADLARFGGLQNDLYLNAVGDGLAKAARDGMRLDWSAILVHVEAQHIRSLRTAGREQRRLILWPVVYLLEIGLGAARDHFPAELRERTFALIASLVGFGTDETGGDPAGLDSNLRAHALETAIQYGLWVAVVIEPARTERRLSENLKELGDLLQVRFARDGEQATRVRAVTGEYFPQLVYLDGEWVTSRLDDVLPRPGSVAGNPTWTAFTGSSPFTHEIFDLARSRYSAALDQLAVGVIGDAESEFRMGLQLVVSLVLGWDADSALVERFFAVAPQNIRRRVINQLGMDLSDREATFAFDALERLQSLWRARIEARDVAELRAFGAWFASGRFAADESLGILERVLEATAGRIDSEDDVAVRLRELLPENPRRVLEAFDRILAGLENPWNAIRLEADGLELVRYGIGDADPGIRRMAERIRDRFGKLGFASFESIARRSSDKGSPQTDQDP